MTIIDRIDFFTIAIRNYIQLLPSYIIGNKMRNSVDNFGFSDNLIAIIVISGANSVFYSIHQESIAIVLILNITIICLNTSQLILIIIGIIYIH
ncbi:hypothetical protein D3C75_1130250 [compost metagenome]